MSIRVIWTASVKAVEEVYGSSVEKKNSHQESSWSLWLHPRAASNFSAEICLGLSYGNLVGTANIKEVSSYYYDLHSSIWHVILLHRAKLSTLGPVAESACSSPQRKSILQDRRLDLMTLLYIASSFGIIISTYHPTPRKFSLSVPTPAQLFVTSPECSFVQATLSLSLILFPRKHFDCILSNCAINLLPRGVETLKAGDRVVVDDVCLIFWYAAEDSPDLSTYINCVAGLMIKLSVFSM